LADDTSSTGTGVAGIERLRRGRSWKEKDPLWGEVYFDRLLPFLTVHRESAKQQDSAMGRIVRSQPSFLIGRRSRDGNAPVYHVIREIADSLLEEFGTILLLEVWTDERLRAGETVDAPLTYRVRIHMPPAYQAERMSRLFYHDLSRIRINDTPVEVSYARTGGSVGPRGLPGIYGDHPPSVPPRADGVVTVGLALSPAFRDEDGGALRPMVLRGLRRQLSFVIQRLHYQFTRTYTNLNPAHHFSLGRRAFSRIAGTVDRRLWQVNKSFDLIMTATPVNTDTAWREFRSRGFQTAPRFLYRPIEVDPDALKQELWNIPVNRVDDPSMERLFEDKRDELDIQLSMLLERNTPRFLYNGLRLYGPVSEELLQTAREVVEMTATKRQRRTGRHSDMGASAFAALVEAELEKYRRDLSEKPGPELPREEYPKVEIRPGISGLLTVRNTLLVSRGYRVSELRAEALIQHEVGTHILTFLNGSHQPIRLLATGLDGYEALQEGLAVTAEFLAGGLDPRRLGLLAARVIAAHTVQEGADFMTTFRTMTDSAGLSPKSAFLVAMRVHRAGGFVKDLIYLQGLVEILEYFRGGGDPELLWTGKVAMRHIRLLEELRYRKILAQPRLIPSYTHSTEYHIRRQALSSGMTITDLIDYR
jgi:uncharacterized protein (TIGR02421 family)